MNTIFSIPIYPIQPTETANESKNKNFTAILEEAVEKFSVLRHTHFATAKRTTAPRVITRFFFDLNRESTHKILELFEEDREAQKQEENT